MAISRKRERFYNCQERRIFLDGAWRGFAVAAIVSTIIAVLWLVS